MRQWKKMIILLILLSSLCACKVQTPQQERYVLGSLWNIDVSGTRDESVENIFMSINMDDVNLYTQGHLYGLQEGLKSAADAPIEHIYHAEGNDDVDIHESINELANMHEAVMIIGAESNQGTMSAASVSNFFKIPMLIPFAKGNELLRDSSNAWIFRTSLSGADISDYLFNIVFAEDFLLTLTNELNADEIVKDQGIQAAVYFQDSKFSELAAIQITETAMNKGFDIEVYDRINSVRFESDLSDKLEEIRSGDLSHIDLVFVMTEDSYLEISDLAIAPETEHIENNPLVFFFGNIGITDDLLKDTDESNMLVVRQKLDEKNCPAEITDSVIADGYVAGVIANHVISRAAAKMPQQKWWERVFFGERERYEQIETMRELVLTELQNFDEEVPCVGMTAFGPNGKSLYLAPEIVGVENGQIKSISVEEVRKRMIEILRSDLEQPYE